MALHVFDRIYVERNPDGTLTRGADGRMLPLRLERIGTYADADTTPPPGTYCMVESDAEAEHIRQCLRAGELPTFESTNTG